MRSAESFRPPPDPAYARGLRLAVLLPCYNEGPVIADVVRSFRAVLPEATIYVYDNNSADDTVANARTAGAVVRRENLQGKGHVVRRMFSDVEADLYLLADGDGTYEAAAAPQLLRKLVDEHLDMVVGVRTHGEDRRAYRFGHVLGNRLLTAAVRQLFASHFSDLLSGYRAMSRRFVKSFPALAGGFEIETTLAVHVLDLRLPYGEVECGYRARPENTASKLRTVRDGLHIGATILLLMKEMRPMLFFGVLSSLFVGSSLLLGIPVVVEFIETGLVPRVPTAILATGLMVLAGIGLTCGLVLDSVSRGRREMKRLHYQSLPALRDSLPPGSA